MTENAAQYWESADRGLKTARMLIKEDPRASVSRAYYAVFYAASAYFATKGIEFKRHSALEAAVHRDLVRTGLISKSLGTAYSSLNDVRNAADYQPAHPISEDEAYEIHGKAREFTEAIGQLLGFELE